MNQHIENAPFWSKNVLTLDEAVQYTGLAKQTIKNMMSQGRIPFSKPCKKVFFERVKLERWLLGNPVKTNEEIEQLAVNKIHSNKSKKRTYT